MARSSADVGAISRLPSREVLYGQLVGLIGAGFGVALIPRNVAESQSIAKAIRIRNPRCYRRIGVSWRNDRFSTEIVAAFREHVGAHHPKAFLTRGTGETTRDPAPLI